MKSNMAVHWYKYTMQIVPIGFLDPQNIHLDTKIKSIATFDLEITANIDFI